MEASSLTNGMFPVKKCQLFAKKKVNDIYTKRSGKNKTEAEGNNSISTVDISNN